MSSKWINAGLSLAVALTTAFATLGSGLLMLVVGPIFAVVGGLLMARRGKVHFIGLGMAVGAVATVVGALVYAWTGSR